jgi:hypothetical protein
LWDFTAADVTGLTSDDLSKILSIAKGHAEARPEGRTALVAPGAFEFGMGRMYEILSDVHDHPIAHHVCKSRAEAERWLLGSA